MGAYQDNLAAARRQRLMRMTSAAAVSDAPQEASRGTMRKEIEAILQRLDVLEASMELPGRGLSGHAVRQSRGQPARPAVSDIKRAICRDYAIAPQDLEGGSRSPLIVQARQIAFYLARQMTASSFQEIGRLFGNRDHTTALHAYHKIKRLRAANHDIDRRVAAIEARLAPRRKRRAIAGDGGAQTRAAHNDQ